ncbi:hypothetical protein CATMIT_01909, partial [Catenibacterium mitsuokai DSM 15897]
MHPRGRPSRLRQRLQGHVAAEADLGALAVEAFDHPAVDVVGIHAEPALGEEMRGRVGHREAGDVEDAHVHRRDGHVGVLAGQLRRADDHRQILLGLHQLRHVEADRDLALAPVHRHEGHADRARRGDLARRAAAAEHQRGDVDVVTLPGVGDRDLELAAGLGGDRLH